MGKHLTITNSSNLFDSQNFATHQLYVTKQKDTELHAAHANNNYDTRNPISKSHAVITTLADSRLRDSRF